MLLGGIKIAGWVSLRELVYLAFFLFTARLEGRLLTGPCMRENRGSIMEYYDLGSDLIDFLDLGQKIYPIPKMIKRNDVMVRLIIFRLIFVGIGYIF